MKINTNILVLFLIVSLGVSCKLGSNGTEDQGESRLHDETKSSEKIGNERPEDKPEFKGIIDDNMEFFLRKLFEKKVNVPIKNKSFQFVLLETVNGWTVNPTERRQNHLNAAAVLLPLLRDSAFMNMLAPNAINIEISGTYYKSDEFEEYQKMVRQEGNFLFFDGNPKNVSMGFCTLLMPIVSTKDVEEFRAELKAEALTKKCLEPQIK